MTKYLIYIAGGLGDFFISIPMIHTIKQVQPDAIIDIFTCSDQNRFKLTNTLVQLQGDVRNAYYYSIKEPLHSLRMILALGNKKYNYGIVLEHCNSQDLSAWPSRIVSFSAKTTIGMHNPYNTAKYDITLERPNHYGVYNAENDLIRAIGIKQSVYENQMYTLFSGGEQKYKNSENKKIIVFTIGAGNSASEDKYGIPSLKSWPVDRWIMVANRLAQEGYDIHLIGGYMEKKLIEPFVNDIHPHIHNDIGVLTIEESLSVVKYADLVVGVDTGMIHGAAVQGTPTLTLFGCSDHAIVKPFGPYSKVIYSNRNCSPCFGKPKAHLCQHNACMTDISVDDVYEAIKTILHV